MTILNNLRNERQQQEIEDFRAARKAAVKRFFKAARRKGAEPKSDYALLRARLKSTEEERKSDITDNGFRTALGTVCLAFFNPALAVATFWAGNINKAKINGDYGALRRRIKKEMKAAPASETTRASSSLRPKQGPLVSARQQQLTQT